MVAVVGDGRLSSPYKPRPAPRPSHFHHNLASLYALGMTLSCCTSSMVAKANLSTRPSKNLCKLLSGVYSQLLLRSIPSGLEDPCNLIGHMDASRRTLEVDSESSCTGSGGPRLKDSASDHRRGTTRIMSFQGVERAEL